MFAHPTEEHGPSPGDALSPGTGAVQRDGWGVNHKRVMREASWPRQLEPRFVSTTNSAYASRTYPNLLADLIPVCPNQAWFASLTSILLPTTVK